LIEDFSATGKGSYMGFLILIVIVLWIWAEIAAFSAIGGEIGGLLTFLGIFITAMIGISLLKRQSAKVMANLKAQVTRGEAPVAPVAQSLSLVVGGILMLIPGYVTDAIGLLMFVPGLSTIFGLAIMHRLVQSVRFRSFINTDNTGPSFSGASFSGGPFSGDTPGQNEPKFRWSGQTEDDDNIIEGDAEERPSKPPSLPKED
jgi:UPF0716 protein FxsA